MSKYTFAKGFAAGAVGTAAAALGWVKSQDTQQSKCLGLATDGHAWWRAGEKLLKKGEADVIFLGAGSSSGIPQPRCLMPVCSAVEELPSAVFVKNGYKLNSDGRTFDCKVCAAARADMCKGFPDETSNYRGNPSILIRFEDTDGVRRHVLIDCGKTFMNSVLRWFPYYGVPGVDAVILTHQHADAVLGLDDIRSVQKAISATENQPIDVFLSDHTMSSLKGMFPYLTLPPPEGTIRRFVAQLNWNIIKPRVEFTAAGLKVVPLSVWHGCDYPHMLAFDFGSDAHRFVYMSDVTKIPDETMTHLKQAPIETMVLDALFIRRTNPTHVNLSQALDILAELKPKRVFLVGMSHDFDSRTFAEIIQEYQSKDPRLAGIDIKMASDGLRVPIRL